MRDPLDLDGLQRLLWAFASHRVVTTAARCGVLARLARDAMQPADVARELQLDPDATAKVVRALHALGILVSTAGGYRVAPSLAGLLGADGDGLLPFLEHSHRMYSAWGEHLEGWLRGGAWPRGTKTADDVRVFGEAMRAMGTEVARRLAAALDLDDVQRMLDVGGGFGQFARILCEESPELHAVVVDRPEVVDLAREELRSDPLAERVEFVGGDYHATELGSGFDLVLLANVLHQESSRDAARLIRRAARALAPGGQVAVLDFRIDDHRHEHVLGTLFAINMRDFGDTWTEPDIRGWMQTAGLDHVERTDIGPDRWLITGRASRLQSPVS
jgi:SAM-dependent methyltransferase